MAAPARTSAGHAGGARTPMRFFLTTSPIHGKMRALFSVASYTQRPRVSVPLFRWASHGDSYVLRSNPEVSIGESLSL